MKRFVLATAAVAAIGTAIAIPVLADGNHGFGEGRYGARSGGMGQMGAGWMMGGGYGQQGPSAMIGGDMGPMIHMMEMMHGSQPGIMGSGILGLGGPMMGGGGYLQTIVDADKNGTVTPEELRAGLLDALKTYDADGNGTLSLEEFETMYMAHIREMTVDRFQAFDADGDGQVTAEEIAAPAERMQHLMDRRGSANQQRRPMMDGEGEGRGMMDNN